MSYNLKLVGKDVSLTDNEGQMIKQLLLEGKTKWLELGDDLINTNQVMALFHEGEPKKFVALPEAPITEEDKANRQKVIGEIRKKFNW